MPARYFKFIEPNILIKIILKFYDQLFNKSKMSKNTTGYCRPSDGMSRSKNQSILNQTDCGNMNSSNLSPHLPSKMASDFDDGN